MNRTLLSVAAIGLAIGSIVSCSDKNATGPNGAVAAYGSTDAYRNVSSVSVSLAPTSVLAGDSATATAVLRDYRGRIVWHSILEHQCIFSRRRFHSGCRSWHSRGHRFHNGHSWIQDRPRNDDSNQPARGCCGRNRYCHACILGTINPGQTSQGTAIARDANNNILTGRAIAWQSSNTAVATESGSGLSSGIAAGTFRR